MDGVAILRVDVPIYFANAQSIKTRLKNFEELLQVGHWMTYLQLCIGGTGCGFVPCLAFAGQIWNGAVCWTDSPSRSICAIPHKCLPVLGSLSSGVMRPLLSFTLLS